MGLRAFGLRYGNNLNDVFFDKLIIADYNLVIAYLLLPCAL